MGLRRFIAGTKREEHPDRATGGADRSAGHPSRLAQGGGFRPDVEGLRAVAVLVVLLYHGGVPHYLVELPWANHTFDFLWGGWGSQITRSSLEAFLEDRLGNPRGTSTKAPTPDG